MWVVFTRDAHESGIWCLSDPHDLGSSAAVSRARVRCTGRTVSRLGFTMTGTQKELVLRVIQGQGQERAGKGRSSATSADLCLEGEGETEADVHQVRCAGGCAGNQGDACVCESERT